MDNGRCICHELGVTAKCRIDERLHSSGRHGLLQEAVDHAFTDQASELRRFVMRAGDNHHKVGKFEVEARDQCRCAVRQTVRVDNQDADAARHHQLRSLFGRGYPPDTLLRVDRILYRRVEILGIRQNNEIRVMRAMAVTPIGHGRRIKTHGQIGTTSVQKSSRRDRNDKGGQVLARTRHKILSRRGLVRCTNQDL